MPLIVQTPSSHTTERHYILGVLLGEFLGLDWDRQYSDRQDVRITLAEQPGRAITLPDRLLNITDEKWLNYASMPEQPLTLWDTRDLGLDIKLIEPTVPVIYGIAEPAASRTDDEISLPVDIFGSAFFMLTRYEEVVSTDRDEHDRFPAWASLAYQEGFLERPIIDEYVEILWAVMKALWPGLRRKEKGFQISVSCDVDRPYESYVDNAYLMYKRVVSDVLKRQSWSLAKKTATNYIKSKQGDYSIDPFNTFDWIMTLNEQAGNRVAFYFIADHSEPAFDSYYDIREQRIRALIREIHDRGHEIGLHGSYATSRDPGQMARETSILRNLIEEEKIGLEILGNRQHYLRWNIETPNHQEEARLAYDSTLCYADYAGFRCGTCHEFSMYDWLSKRTLSIVQRPLIVMECSVIEAAYMGLGVGYKSYNYVDSLMSACKLVNGTFSLLWHNTSLKTDQYKDLFKEIIGRG